MGSKTIEILLGFSGFTVTGVEVSSLRLDIQAESNFEESVCPCCLKK